MPFWSAAKPKLPSWDLFFPESTRGCHRTYFLREDHRRKRSPCLRIQRRIPAIVVEFISKRYRVNESELKHAFSFWLIKLLFYANNTFISILILIASTHPPFEVPLTSRHLSHFRHPKRKGQHWLWSRRSYRQIPKPGIPVGLKVLQRIRIHPTAATLNIPVALVRRTRAIAGWKLTIFHACQKLVLTFLHWNLILVSTLLQTRKKCGMTSKISMRRMWLRNWTITLSPKQGRFTMSTNTNGIISDSRCSLFTRLMGSECLRIAVRFRNKSTRKSLLQPLRGIRRSSGPRRIL